LYFSLYGAGRR